MSKSRWLVPALLCSLVAAPAISKAQATDTTKKQTEDFIHELIRGLAGPNWNVFLDGGVTTGDRFLLQQAVNPADGQRSLQTAAGYNVGAGVGVDLLLHIGVRASYSYTSSNMNFKTDNGNGSNALNIDDVARLKSNTVTLEAMRYMLTSRVPITPYGTLGVQATWWSLNEKSPLVTSAGAGTPFSISPLFAFGVQFKVVDRFSGRLEAELSSGHNPFTGNQSFRSFAGPVIDEPTNVNRTAFRLAAVYHFGKPKMPSLNTPMAQH